MPVFCIFANKEKNGKQSNSFGMEKLKWEIKILKIDQRKREMEISGIDNRKIEGVRDGKKDRRKGINAGAFCFATVGVHRSIARIAG